MKVKNVMKDYEFGKFVGNTGNTPALSTIPTLAEVAGSWIQTASQTFAADGIIAKFNGNEAVRMANTIVAALPIHLLKII